MKMTLTILLSFFLLILSFDCKSLKTRTQSCSKPIYIINAYTGLSLGLTSFSTCPNNLACCQYSRATAVLNKNFDSWCYTNNNILYATNTCAISFYADMQPSFQALFPQAMMNTDNLRWNIVPVGTSGTPSNNGFSHILSLSEADRYYALGVNAQGGLILGAPTNDIKFSWIIAPK